MEDFALRPYTAADAPAVVEVVNAASMRTVGFPRAVVDSTGNLWAYGFVPFSSSRVVAVDHSDRVIGYGYFSSTGDHITAETGGSVHPEHWHRGVGTALLGWAEARARVTSSQAPQGVRTVLQASLYGAEQDGMELFRNQGYRPVREWVHLVLEMNGPPDRAVLAPPLTLRPMDLEVDWDLVGPAMDEAYADHWGAVPPGAYQPVGEVKSEPDPPAEQETPAEDSSYSNAPGYCFIVLDGETVAGGVLCNARLVERPDTGRVGSLFVRPRYRRQGIARALMLAAFHAFWKTGLRRVITDTDARSFTQAPTLYQGLGMKPYRTEFTYEKEICPGREVRLLERISPL